MDINPTPSVEALLAAGRYGEAAAACEQAGQHARAADLYERIWDFAAACRAARAAGDRVRALRHALDAGRDDWSQELARELATTGEAGQRAALEVYVKKRRHAEAGALAEALADLPRAAELYRLGHLHLDAARVLAAQGKERDAGQLLERVLAESTSDEERAAVHLELGRLLAALMQHEQATAHLQAAATATVAPVRIAAQRALVSELAALGLRDAARDILRRVRDDAPELPATLEEYLRAARPSPAVRAAEVELVAGRYRLDRLIGYGATGRVFRALDEVLGRTVALKMFATGSPQGSPAFERFLREGRVASSLRHPNLVEVHDFSAERGYIAMEYMVGGSLEARLGSPLPGGHLRRLALDLVAGLELAHQRGIVHRDVKPANVFFDARGSGKLGDFGVAHLLDLGQTQTGGLIGTLAYMSPEQVTGAPLTVAADFYSLGITLFEALTGRLPFLGPDFVAQHLGEPAPAPSALAEVTPGWDPLFARLLAKSPDQRFTDAAELRAAIAAVDLGAEGSPAVLALPRASARPRRETGRAHPVAVVERGDAPRYQFETAIGQTAISTLHRAVDSVLDRSVVVERFDLAGLDPATRQRLLNLARSNSPYVQRALGFDREAGVAIFEAPAGRPLADLPGDPALAPRQAARLLKRLARALASFHELGQAHGRLGPTTIVIDDGGLPAVLVSGLGPADPAATPAADVAAVIALVAGAAGAPATLDELFAAWVDRRGDRAPRPAPPTSGEELYAIADTLEVAILHRGRAA